MKAYITQYIPIKMDCSALISLWEIVLVDKTNKMSSQSKK